MQNEMKTTSPCERVLAHSISSQPTNGSHSSDVLHVFMNMTSKFQVNWSEVRETMIISADACIILL